MRVISTISLFLIYQITFENTTQVIVQNTIPPKAIDKNTPIQEKYVFQETIHHSKIIPKIIKNNARAVPSLNKLSHSKISVSLLGAPIVLNIDKTATGSVAEISHQNKRHTKKGISKPINGSIKYIKLATINVEIKSPTTAKSVIDFQLFTSCL